LITFACDMLLQLFSDRDHTRFNRSNACNIIECFLFFTSVKVACFGTRLELLAGGGVVSWRVFINNSGSKQHSFYVGS